MELSIKLKNQRLVNLWLIININIYEIDKFQIGCDLGPLFSNVSHVKRM